MIYVLTRKKLLISFVYFDLLLAVFDQKNVNALKNRFFRRSTIVFLQDPNFFTSSDYSSEKGNCNLVEILHGYDLYKRGAKSRVYPRLNPQPSYERG